MAWELSDTLEMAFVLSCSALVSHTMMGQYNAQSRADWKTRLRELVRFELVAQETYAPKMAENGETVSETYVYRLTMRKSTLIITFLLTPDGKIGLQTRSDC